jgi:D-sedoheptulose 7-phosphate isomerase
MISEFKKTSKKIEQDIKENIQVKKRILKDNIAQIVKASEICIDSINNGGKLIFCGNGGSASDAHHLATELLIRLRPNVNRKPIAAMSLNLDTTSLTACGNDYNYDVYLARMLEALGKKEDVLISISTSGNSKNILKVIKKANQLKIKTVSFLGKNGGAAKKLSKNNIIIKSNSTARIQEAHICIGHILMELIENSIIYKNK